MLSASFPRMSSTGAHRSGAADAAASVCWHSSPCEHVLGAANGSCLMAHREPSELYRSSGQSSKVSRVPFFSRIKGDLLSSSDAFCNPLDKAFPPCCWLKPERCCSATESGARAGEIAIAVPGSRKDAGSRVRVSGRRKEGEEDNQPLQTRRKAGASLALQGEAAVVQGWRQGPRLHAHSGTNYARKEQGGCALRTRVIAAGQGQ